MEPTRASRAPNLAAVFGGGGVDEDEDEDDSFELRLASDLDVACIGCVLDCVVDGAGCCATLRSTMLAPVVVDVAGAIAPMRLPANGSGDESLAGCSEAADEPLGAGDDVSESPPPLLIWAAAADADAVDCMRAARPNSDWMSLRR